MLYPFTGQFGLKLVSTGSKRKPVFPKDTESRIGPGSSLPLSAILPAVTMARLDLLRNNTCQKQTVADPPTPTSILQNRWV